MSTLDHDTQRDCERAQTAPAVDIYENDQEVLLVADLPGVERDGLQVHIDRDQLTIEGRRQLSSSHSLRQEYVAHDYRRSFVLPQGIDVAQVSAELKQGMLWLKLPKAAQLRSRRIEITS